MAEAMLQTGREQLLKALGTPLTNPNAVSDVLRIGSRKYVRDCCRRGDIPAVKVGGAWLVNTEKLLTQLGL